MTSVAEAAPTSYAVIAGAGSAGLTWGPVAQQLDALVLPIPDEPDVPAMAAAVEDRLAGLPEPRVLVGTSAGGVVALEIARYVPVQALVFVAAGFGLKVSESALNWLADNPPDLHYKLARICVVDRENEEQHRALVADYDACGQPVHLRQLQAVVRHRPEPLQDPPPTLVLWGMQDRAIPLEDHLELAVRCSGALVPIADAAHVPFLEQPGITLEWLRRAAAIARDH